MSDDFDPYYAWLGIPPKEQPCNLYRLLGLTIFEADLDVIEAAAARQIAHVRNYQLKHPEDATRVLQELVEAKSCLMNADRKIAYDQTLVIPVAVEHVPPPVARDPIQNVPIQSAPIESIPSASDAVTVQSGLQIQVRADQDSHHGKPRRHNKKMSSGKWFLIALGGLGGTGIAFLLLWLITGGSPLSLLTSTEAVVSNQDSKRSANSNNNETPPTRDSTPEIAGQQPRTSDPSSVNRRTFLENLSPSSAKIPESPGNEKDAGNSNDTNLSPNPARFAPSGDPPPLAIAPFNLDEAKAHQQAWAKYLKVPVEYTNELGMKFTLIPPGEFFMGCTPAESDLLLEYASQQMSHSSFNSYQGNVVASSPQRKVGISQPFYLSVRETTFGQFETITNNKVTSNANAASNINWNQATEFCQQLSGLGEREFTYRLPTSAEWEMACRAGSTGLQYFEDDADKTALDTKPPADGPLSINPWGLRDMYGSLGEWTAD